MFRVRVGIGGSGGMDLSAEEEVRVEGWNHFAATAEDDVFAVGVI